MKILKKYKFPDNSLIGIKSDLNSVANKDLFMRVAHSKSMGKDKDLGREKFISFDALAQYLLYDTRWLISKWLERNIDIFRSIVTSVSSTGQNTNYSMRTYEQIISAVEVISNSSCNLQMSRSSSCLPTSG